MKLICFLEISEVCQNIVVSFIFFEKVVNENKINMANQFVNERARKEVTKIVYI